MVSTAVYGVAFTSWLLYLSLSRAAAQNIIGTLSIQLWNDSACSIPDTASNGLVPLDFSAPYSFPWGNGCQGTTPSLQALGFAWYTAECTNSSYGVGDYRWMVSLDLLTTGSNSSGPLCSLNEGSEYFFRGSDPLSTHTSTSCVPLAAFFYNASTDYTFKFTQYATYTCGFPNGAVTVTAQNCLSIVISVLVALVLITGNS